MRSWAVPVWGCHGAGLGSLPAALCWEIMGALPWDTLAALDTLAP